MNWNSEKQHFNDHKALIDIYYEAMDDDAWAKLFNWLASNNGVSSVNCYVPDTDENLEKLPANVAQLINQDGFYCFVSLITDGISIVLRFYEKGELECDISPREINSEEKLLSLLQVLGEIREITGVKKYIICPENNKEGTFNINGVFIK